MYEIKLIFKNFKQHSPSVTYREAITHCATIELFLRGIHTAQTSASRIAFESDRDRMLGVLILSASEQFTPVVIEKDSSFR